MQIWKLCLATRHAETAGDILLDAGAGAVFCTAAGDTEFVEAYFAARPDLRRMEAVLPPHDNLAAEILPASDWVGMSQTGRPAVIQPPFMIFERGRRPEHPGGRIRIELQAGRAFGTGHHETTRGCLTMLTRLLKRTRPRTVLDLGCGTGVLAIALAKITRRKILACDIDPEAVRVTRENSRLNHVGQLVRVRESDGFHKLAPPASGFDLIVANILAGPLKKLAAGFRANLAAPSDQSHVAGKTGGHLVVSGLLKSQETRIAASLRQVGLRFQDKLTLDEWTTLWFRR